MRGIMKRTLGTILSALAILILASSCCFCMRMHTVTIDPANGEEVETGRGYHARGYAAAVMRFDAWLPAFLSGMRRDDLLMITADHGCDPNFSGTDHTREDVPLLVYGRKIRPVNLGTLSTYSDIAATIADYFGVPYSLNGSSFLGRIA